MGTAHAILDKLNSLSWVRDRDRAVFVLGRDVSYRGLAAIVPRSKLLDAEAFDEALAASTIGGPSWIHANLVRGARDEEVIIVDVGPPIGASRWSINVSAEVNVRAEIV